MFTQRQIIAESRKYFARERVVADESGRDRRDAAAVLEYLLVFRVLFTPQVLAKNRERNGFAG